MDTREHDLLSRTLHGLAETAPQDPELGPRFAEKAWLDAARRRTTRTAMISVMAAAAVATMITAPLAFRGSGSEVSPATGRSPKPIRTLAAPSIVRLPANTPAQLAIVRACMVGDPSIPLPNQPLTQGKQTGPGTHVADFRVLATSKMDIKGQVVLIGSVVAHRVCQLDPSGRPAAYERIPHQTANPWQVPLATHVHDFVFDDGGGGQFGEKDQTFAQIVKAGWSSGIAGRTAPAAARITFTSMTGRSLEATVKDGFFIVRHLGEGLMPEGPPVSAVVRLYAADGHLLTSRQVSVDANLFK